MTSPIARQPGPVQLLHAGPAPSSMLAKNAFFRFYEANQSDNLAKRPGWPTKGQTMKLNGGVTLTGLGSVAQLPKGSKAAHAVDAVIKAGVDGDQSAFLLKAGNTTYLAVGVFPDDQSRDKVWLWDHTGENRVAVGEPNQNTGKLQWK